MQSNLSGLGKALGFSRQYANKLSQEPGFPYLQKPGEQGATRWLVDVGQVRRWLEERDAEAAELARDREAFARQERASRDFWCKLLHQGYQPEDIKSIRDGCFTVEDLQREARRLRITLDA